MYDTKQLENPDNVADFTTRDMSIFKETGPAIKP